MFEREFESNAPGLWSGFAARFGVRGLNIGVGQGIYSPYYATAKYTSETQRKKSDICVSPGCSLRIEQIISSLHKMNRRGHTGWLNQMLSSFFAAVDRSYKEDAQRFMSKKTGKDTLDAVLKAHVTKVLNRIVITILEDTAIVALLNQKKFLKAFARHMARARAQAHAKQWNACAQTVQTVFSNFHEVPRARLPSYIKLLVKMGRIQDSELNAGMAEEKLESVKKNAYMNTYLAWEYLSPLQEIFENEDFKKNGELCKLIHMNCVIARSKIVPMAFTPETLVWNHNSMVYPMTFSFQDWKGTGANDKHAGRHGTQGELEWLQQGVTVRNPKKLLPRIYGFSHQELENLYRGEKMRELDFRHAVLETKRKKNHAGLPEAKRKKMGTQTENDPSKNKKKRNATDNCDEAAPKRCRVKKCTEPANERLLNYYGNTIQTVPEVVQYQSEIVDISGSDRIYGWKRPSAKGVLLVDIGVFKRGEDVFIKFFEDHNSMRMTKNYYEYTREIGHFAPKAALVYVKYQEGLWADLYKSTNAPESWHKAYVLGKRPDTQLMLIVEHVPAISMKKMPRSEIKYDFTNNKMMMRTFIQEMLKSKFLGLGDLNLFNLIVSTNPNTSRVIRVDCAYVTKSRITGPAGEKDPRPYNDCSFQTSQPMHVPPQLANAVERFVKENHRKVAKMIENVILNYASVACRHVRCTWFDNPAIVKRLQDGHEDVIDLFITHLLSDKRPSCVFE